VDHYYSTEGGYTPPGGNAILVAQAITADTSLWKDPVTQEVLDIDSATMTFEGVFPGIDFLTDVELEYLGTIPAKISLAEITPAEGSDPADAAILEALWDLGMNGDATHDPHTLGIWIDAELSTDDGANWIPVPNPEDELELLGLQLEREDLVHINMHVLLPEDPAYEHLSLSFSGQINVIQWNEYEEPE
jgi:hypothetical protein